MLMKKQTIEMILQYISLAFVVLWLFFAWKEFAINSVAVWNDIMIMLDVSKSMEVIDMDLQWKRVTRLEFAKEKIKNIAKNNVWKKIWLWIFAWSAEWVIPLTYDHTLMVRFLDTIDVSVPLDVWTQLIAAIEYGTDRFKDKKEGSLLIFTDWWEEDVTINEWEFLYENLKVYLIWVGSSAGWPIPEENILSWPSFKQFEWSTVISKLEVSNLQKIAQKLNWEILTLDQLEKFQTKGILQSSDIHKQRTSLIRYIRYCVWIAWILFLTSILVSFLPFEQYDKY